MKKITALLLLSAVLLLLVSCGNSGNTDDSTAESGTTPTETESSAPEGGKTDTDDDMSEETDETYVMKLGRLNSASSDASFSIEMYADENGEENVNIDDFSDVDFSRYKGTGSTGLISFKEGFTYYTVTDGVINEGHIIDAAEDNMIILEYKKGDDGAFTTTIYIYK